MSEKTKQSERERDLEDGAAGFGRGYSTAADVERTNSHYDQPAEFFTTLTGGEWNTYSCDLWDGASSQTESQERKLDALARLMRLQPGQRVLDVGSGWGGPLVYLAKRYGVRGVGISPSPRQAEWANARAQRYGVDAAFGVSHWRDLDGAGPFDAIYTDEVIVHFHDLREFFEKCRTLLAPGGRMLNKELHYASTALMAATRARVLINRSFGETGNYRTLHDELRLLDEAGFAVEWIEQIPLSNYQRTLDCWVRNMDRSREYLVGLVGEEAYERFRTYYRILRRGTSAGSMTLDVVVAR